jgi:hypothetical protein
VPTDAEIDNMTFIPLTDANGHIADEAAQRGAFKQFIGQDKYLSGLRGKYTEKYGGETPWFSQVDMRILQDFNFKGKDRTSTLQFSIDLINLGNLLDSKWGVRKYATTSGYFQPLSVIAGTTPSYQFDPALTETFIASPDIISRWQLQFGLRYIF